MLANPFHKQTDSRVSVHAPIQPCFRTIDGLSIRFAESEKNGTQNGDALLLSPWPESLYAFEPMWSRLAETTHWSQSISRGLASRNERTR
jgi:hypothetical protein